MEPLFKVGDKVRVVKRIYNPSEYREGFVDEMAELAGDVYTINHYRLSFASCRGVLDDGYCYYLKEDSGNWCWNSSMLEKVEDGNSLKETSSKENDDSVLKIKLKKKNNIKLNFNN